MRVPFIAMALLAAFNRDAHAARFPTRSADDPRIGYVDYKQDEVIRITVQRGIATRILLAPDEKIASGGAGTGFPADCNKPELEWCLHADAGSNQILVKPREGATHNNLELRTNQRDYSFEFDVVSEPVPRQQQRTVPSAKPETAMYRVVFRYPERSNIDAGQLARALLRQVPLQDAAGGIAAASAAPGPVPRNWRYSMQIGAGSEDIVPTLVFDDGRFTYFRFPANREVPTIYVIASSGEEARVNFHMDAADADITVVERMGRRFMLRLGSAIVSIWNDAFDSYGIAPADGTTVDGLARSIR